MKRTLLLSLVVLLVFGQNFNSYAAAVTTGKETTESATAAVTPAVPAMESVKDAMKEFKHLSRKEKKERIKEAKKEIKQYKIDKKNGEPSTNTLLLVILAILLPPLAVYLHEGEINSKFWLDLLLTILFILPGIIYALIVILGDD